MPEPAINFRAILQHLLDSQVRFVVIGGVAMHLHGANNFTVDFDISFDRDAANCAALASALNARHARLRGVPEDLPFVLDARTFRNVANLTLETDLGDFDLLAEPSGIESFAGLWERAVVMTAADLTFRVASLDDLIAMKRAANRPKDQAHVMELLALKRLMEEQG